MACLPAAACACLQSYCHLLWCLPCENHEGDHESHPSSKHIENVKEFKCSSNCCMYTTQNTTPQLQPQVPQVPQQAPHTLASNNMQMPQDGLQMQVPRIQSQQVKTATWMDWILGPAE